MIHNTLEDASIRGRSEIAVGMAGIAYKATAATHNLSGDVFPCGESLNDVSAIRMRPVTYQMQTAKSEGR